MKLIKFTLLFTLISNLFIFAHASEITVVTDPHQKALGPYSHATIANGFLFASGVIAIDPKTGQIFGNNVKDQTRQVFDNIRSVLAAGGATLNDVVKVTVFLKNPEDFPAMNEVYTEYFTTYKPARTTVPGVEWGHGILVEIVVIAVLPKSEK